MMTLAQLYDLGLSYSIDLFDGLALPEGSPLDLDIIKNVIMERCGLNIPMYADPKIMQSAIRVWSAKNQYTFTHIAAIYEASYSPIENYDRFENNTENHTRELSDKTDTTSEKSENTKVDNTTNNTNSNNTSHSGVDSTTSKQDTSAYNEGGYSPEDQQITSITHGERITDSGSANTKVNGESNKDTSGTSNTNKDVSESENTTITNHMHGNIGVTTAMAMEKEEYELIGKYNPYNFIAEIFENELTLFVY